MKEISFNRLSFSFKTGEPVLTDLTASFAPGAVHLLTGPSGSGKSTILKLIAGLLPKYGGQVTAGSLTVPEGSRSGMLFQDPVMQFALDTPRHELEFTLENCQVPRRQMKGQIATALRFAQVTSLADRKITTLSGGQQQRVALAAVVAMKPTILLLDEPFANVDSANRQLILNQLAQLNRKNKTTIIITDHECFGYQELHPQVWQLRDHHLHALTPKEGNELLRHADQQEAAPIRVTMPSKGEQAIVDFTDLTIHQGDSVLLTPTNLRLVKNKTTLLTGANGVGKSTLLKALARLLPYGGQIKFQGTDIQKISPGKYFRDVGLIFQHANDQFLNVTVGEELALSRQHGHNPFFTSARLQQALSDLQLNGHEDQVVYSLSGGQKKKLQLLLMLMMGQQLLLLDEPFTGLDSQSLATILQLIRESRQVMPLTIVVVSHQLSGIENFVDYHLVMQNQQLSYQRN
jgi:energy-coupling factor transport system ATP-binding protein